MTDTMKKQQRDTHRDAVSQQISEMFSDPDTTKWIFFTLIIKVEKKSSIISFSVLFHKMLVNPAALHTLCISSSVA